MGNPKQIVIVGGVAGGASCAARARRLDEHARIIILERGPHVSFASCGLPYHVGDVVRELDDLVVVTPRDFLSRHGIEVRLRHEVVCVEPQRRVVRVRDLARDEELELLYDALVLATGGREIRPPVPGLDLPGVFALRTLADSQGIRDWMDLRGARHAVVVGGGFVGIETVENLVLRGLSVTLLELQDQVLGHLDPEVAGLAERELRRRGVEVLLGEGLTGIERDGAGLRVRTGTGREISTDLVVLGLGIRPETTLAQGAGLQIGETGGVKVDEQQRTSDPHIYAVGDVVEKTCLVTGQPLLMPLAGPATLQGRVAADAISGRSRSYRGSQGTAVCGLFDLTVASTGVCEKQLRRRGVAHQAVWLHPKDHVGWFPGAESLHLKLLFAPEDGRVLGAQAVGPASVTRRIDVIAMAIRLGATVYDLEEVELAYAPAYGAPKDPVNLAGMIAANHLRGDLPLADWTAVEHADALLVDVREAHEFEGGHVPGAVNLPLSQLRERLNELPADRELLIYCLSGKRSYDAARALSQRGFRVRNLPGGITTWRMLA